MESNNELEFKDGKYRLTIHEDATVSDYEKIIDYVLKKVQPSQVNATNDYDTYHHTFDYKGKKILFSFREDFGIRVVLYDGNDPSLQKELLQEIREIIVNM